MNDQPELEQRTRVELEAGRYLEALDALDELAAVNVDLAVTLYKTYRERMYRQMEKWADDVIRCSCENMLLPPGIFKGDISEEITSFEKEHGVPKNSSTVSPKLKDAKKIIDEERKVRPDNLTQKSFHEMEKILFEHFRTEEKWSETVRRFRSSYSAEHKQLGELFASLHNLIRKNIVID